ncbi:MAG: transposase, partial [Anaerococcus sp.]|nr:transposase [Anaerococcus sp.]
MNDLLRSELTVFLDYEKWEYKCYGSGNSKNGYYHRSLKTRFGELELQMPRDRASQFKQKTVKAYARNTDNLENKDFVVLYCDATYLPVRRNSVAKEALHVIIGIDPNGNKEVLDYSLFPEESANNYKEMLINLKSRGLENVLLFVSDGLVLHELDGLAL